MISCNGTGECLQLNEYTVQYYKVNNVKCKYNCIPIHCPNYIICRSMVPRNVLNYYNGLCYYCDNMFGVAKGGKGILKAVDNVECPICLETTRCVTQPKCEHTICVECFKRCYYGDYNEKTRPKFPYSKEYEQSYYSDYNNPLWINDKAVKKWLDDWDKWNKIMLLKNEKENYLQLCPI